MWTYSHLKAQKPKTLLVNFIRPHCFCSSWSFPVVLVGRVPAERSLGNPLFQVHCPNLDCDLQWHHGLPVWLLLWKNSTHQGEWAVLCLGLWCLQLCECVGVKLLLEGDSTFLFFLLILLQLSPKKTWEGFIGGFFSTVVFGFMVRRP